MPTWTDQSGYGNYATQVTAVNQPAFRTNILNGQPVIRFDGVASPNNDYLNLPSILNPITRTPWLLWRGSIIQLAT